MKNMELSMSYVLLELPLFQGVGKIDLKRMVEGVKWDFSKYAAKKVIIKDGTPCDGISFLIKGNVEMITQSADHAFSLTETLSAPDVLQPEVLFGLYTRYTHTYVAGDGGANLVSIPKCSITDLLLKNEVFRINYLNYLSTRAQRNQQSLWKACAEGTEKQIAHFIYQHVEYPAGEKILSIKMEDLAVALNESRLNVSKALNELQEKNLIQLRRKEIYIPAIEKLLGAY